MRREQTKTKKDTGQQEQASKRMTEEDVHEKEQASMRGTAEVRWQRYEGNAGAVEKAEAEM